MFFHPCVLIVEIGSKQGNIPSTVGFTRHMEFASPKLGKVLKEDIDKVGHIFCRFFRGALIKVS